MLCVLNHYALKLCFGCVYILPNILFEINVNMAMVVTPAAEM